MFHEVLTGERLVRDVNRESDSLWPMIQWYHAMPQYKGAAEVCNNLLQRDARARPSVSFVQSVTFLQIRACCGLLVRLNCMIFSVQLCIDHLMGCRPARP